MSLIHYKNSRRKGKLVIRILKISCIEFIQYLFVIFCFIPFLFPNPVVRTNIQPYAAVLGTVILLFYFNSVLFYAQSRNWFIIGGITFAIAIIIMLLNGITIEALRGVYNYYALWIIPCAVVCVLRNFHGIPETMCKCLIIIWFVVASIQFFIYRGFATQLISGVKWSFGYRGVVGLASEPSFLGIACFYFLHIIRSFNTKKTIFASMIIIMAVLYAQSTIGIIFILGYLCVYLLDVINSKKGLFIWGGTLVAVWFFIYLLHTKLADSRLNQLITSFLKGGIDNVLDDGSASVRMNAISRSLRLVYENAFLPNGFGARIGSGYGGFLVELGIISIPCLFLISFYFAKTFSKKRSFVLYFGVITLLLFNNTQIGNPLLLLTIGINIFENISNGDRNVKGNKKI